MNREEGDLNSLRRVLLEVWAMLVLATTVGFMGPFGTYSTSGLAIRIAEWCMLLFGAYLIVRPAIVLLEKLATAAGLHRGMLTFWGTVFFCGPLSGIWLLAGAGRSGPLAGASVLWPSSVLCSLAVLAVTRWAAGADQRLSGRMAPGPEAVVPVEAEAGDAASPAPVAAAVDAMEPALVRRLSPGFQGPIMALQSEDHYVRVHGARDSELLLMRLRDAIAEMDGIAGEQVHRSWWVAQSAVSGASASGRSWVIRLAGGQTAPVARDSIARLQRAGFLPVSPDEGCA